MRFCRGLSGVCRLSVNWHIRTGRSSLRGLWRGSQKIMVGEDRKRYSTLNKALHRDRSKKRYSTSGGKHSREEKKKRWKKRDEQQMRPRTTRCDAAVVVVVVVVVVLVEGFSATSTPTL